jgi:hypothetical protein
MPIEEPNKPKPTRRSRLVCANCGSADFTEHANRNRVVAITYYVGGGERVRRVYDEETDFQVECNNCGLWPSYEQMVPEQS